MRSFENILLVASLAVGSHLADGQEKPSLLPEPGRVREIAAMLREEPGTFGQPVGERDAWQAVAASEAGRSAVRSAERILGEPIPPFTEEIYKGIVASGSRADHNFYYARRPGALASLVIAECCEDQGRFLPRLEELIGELCRENTWIVPVRKQQSLDNWDGRSDNIDLNKAMRAWEMALAHHLLGDRLLPATRQLIRANLEQRIFAPYRRMLDGGQKPDMWIAATHNWNAVCLAGVTGTALTVLESRDERAFYAAAAERHVRNFREGFTEDGYCSEGLGYWNFGFGHYLVLSEALWQATGGGLDLFAVPSLENMARFGERIELDNGISPAFADCVPDTRPTPFIMHFMSRRLGWGRDDWEQGDMARTAGPLYERLIGLFPNSASQTPPATERTAGLPARSYFEQAGILVCRPGPGSTARLAAAMKGGHNAEHHNHNDVGSFTVATAFGTPILDVGAEVYTNRTFSPRRYDSPILNSYGHPVPLVAGKLQATGAAARATVLRADFTPETDTFALDLAPAYQVPDLRRLERTFVFSRRGAGSLTVTDRVEFATPQAFGTALMTVGEYELAGGSLVFRDGEGGVRVEIEASAAHTVKPETFPDPIRLRGKQATRLGIDLDEPVLEATITTRIVPLAPAADPGQPLVRNGGFEEGLLGWLAKDGGMTTLAAGPAASGQAAVRIVDASPEKGSDLLSDRFPLEPDTDYILRGMVLARSGEGVGVFVRLLGRRDEILQKTSEERQQSYLTVGDSPAGDWQPFAKPFRTTPDTRYGRIWLHSFNALTADVFLDDLEVVPAAP